MNSDVSVPFSRRYRADRIGRDGMSGQIEANPEERDAVARLIGLEALDRLVLHFEVEPIARERFRIRGQLEADVTQTCVVTLEDVRTRVAEELEVEFWPEQDLQGSVQADQHLSDDPDVEDPEPITDGVIDLGRLTFECLATGLDPYPRRAGAVLDWTGTREAEAADDESHPFDALRALKRD